MSQRYEDWGWPATIMFDGQGRELDKERGYVGPAAMAQVLQADALDYLLLNASAGDETAQARVRQTLLNARALIDPVWGGIFQYSDEGT